MTVKNGVDQEIISEISLMIFLLNQLKLVVFQDLCRWTGFIHIAIHVY